MSADSLQSALHALGISCTVEARDALAVIMPAGEGAAYFRDAAKRRAILALLPEHGFTHLALEIPDQSVDAAVPRD